MICHKHKCILVHIPACAGSSMEKAIVGYDWWDKDPETKHLKSHQAKKIYSEYWSDYFKFSFVRNPWSRTLSLAQHKCHKVHVNHKTKEINLIDWVAQTEDFEVFPMDGKKHLYDKKPKQNAIYLNYLLEDLDFVGRFENLKADWEYIKDKLKIKNNLPKIQDTKSPMYSHYSDYYDEKSNKIILSKYQKDIEYFNYKFE